MIGAENIAMPWASACTSAHDDSCRAPAGSSATSCQAAHSHLRLGSDDAASLRRSRYPYAPPKIHFLAAGHMQHMDQGAFSRAMRKRRCVNAVPRSRRARPDARKHHLPRGGPCAPQGDIRPRCGTRAPPGWLKMAATPASSATRSEPVDDPMNTLCQPRQASVRGPDIAALSCVPPTQKAKSQCMRPLARATLSLSAAASVVKGLVLGISKTAVTPPSTAARAPVSKSSLCLAPGSRKCTWCRHARKI